MDRLRVYYDKRGNTLSVWFDDPKKECVCVESDDDVVLVKDRAWSGHRLRASELPLSQTTPAISEHRRRSANGLNEVRLDREIYTEEFLTRLRSACRPTMLVRAHLVSVEGTGGSGQKTGKWEAK